MCPDRTGHRAPRVQEMVGESTETPIGGENCTALRGAPATAPRRPPQPMIGSTRSVYFISVELFPRPQSAGEGGGVSGITFGAVSKKMISGRKIMIFYVFYFCTSFCASAMPTKDDLRDTPEPERGVSEPGNCRRRSGEVHGNIWSNFQKIDFGSKNHDFL